MRKQLQHALRHDPITGTLCANAFAASIEHTIERRRTISADDPGGIMLAVIVNDFDGIGRRYGPHWADTVMQSLVRIVESCIRSGDLVARLGTDELGIYLPGATTENARDIGKRIREGVGKATFSAEDAALSIDVKLGDAIFNGGETFVELRQRASAAAYSPVAHFGSEAKGLRD